MTGLLLLFAACVAVAIIGGKLKKRNEEKHAAYLEELALKARTLGEKAKEEAREAIQNTPSSDLVARDPDPASRARELDGIKRDFRERVGDRLKRILSGAGR